jgi:hypothetical protein
MCSAQSVEAEQRLFDAALEQHSNPNNQKRIVTCETE